jgi:hypothetical protein
VKALKATISVGLIGDMMPELTNPVQQPQTIIEIRPFKGGWQCYEGPGVQPYWTGDTAKEDAIGYATARAKFGRGEIRVLDQDGSVETVIPFNEPGSSL